MQLKSLHFSLFITFSLWWPRYDLLSIYIQWHSQSRVLTWVVSQLALLLLFHPPNFLTLSLSSPFQFKASDHNRSTIHHFLFTRYAENEIPTLTMSTLYYFISLNQTKQNRFIFYEYVFFFFQAFKIWPFFNRLLKLLSAHCCFMFFVHMSSSSYWQANLTRKVVSEVDPVPCEFGIGGEFRSKSHSNVFYRYPAKVQGLWENGLSRWSAFCWWYCLSQSLLQMLSLQRNIKGAFFYYCIFLFFACFVSCIIYYFIW